MSSFKLSWKNYDLTLHQPFTISRDTKKVVHNILVELSNGSITGYGEAGPNVRYNEDARKVTDFLQTIPDDFFDKVESLEQLAKKLDDHCQSVSPVKSAKVSVEMTWLDWFGKTQNQPVWKMWGASSPAGPVTSYTIGLDTIPVMQEKAKKASEFPVYKVKLGTERDREIILALREITDKPIRVDANEGWTTLDQALEMMEFLKDQQIELVEQPMPAENLEELKKLKKEAPLPLCADESFMGTESLEEIAEAFDIINIKLMKTGSIYKARKLVEQAHKSGLQVMIGCMIESSIANAAGALVSLWADYCDLDGHLLIKDDPAEGLELTEAKRVKLSDKPGLGVELT
jgi:L-alanine-DL-glutamate epimerase-like enolase superfamily enzyme